MNLIIGILGRPKMLDKKIASFSSSLTDVIIDKGNIPLGIIAPVKNENESMNIMDIKKLKKSIDLCDGIILQGGSDYYQYDLEAIKHIYKKKIPILGICLGMQSMAVSFGSDLIAISNHNHSGIDYVHEVLLEEQSMLFKIIGQKKIMVNSRHNEMAISPKDLKIVGLCNNVIEAVEKEDHPFFIGVQWHPEDMAQYDERSRKLFTAFFSSCNAYKEKNKKL
ncbi:MAG: gamma-glutamyl-gamma-aminobutyrate hydrolase family protein [Bacilli bacterium]|nr:gamma-glutamyl-gamma-aminobutyrate hydrolase family protein [Bacilli bacterium]MDD3305284.1 gamma-glutamyl-gamma-aminobutyrate hydrolase family protein [Bacilli bacterium]MDD4053574.1 gamma-glutamyl-gamma-aminobutyrate hydrolase family protein [Bacilli bacterium]MDD4411459.1 gamma-glutamyl-gamma-aminobutyrate hydrolase family protein [Bacilli bacterium]